MKDTMSDISAVDQLVEGSSLPREVTGERRSLKESILSGASREHKKVHTSDVIPRLIADRAHSHHALGEVRKNLHEITEDGAPIDSKHTRPKFVTSEKQSESSLRDRMAEKLLGVPTEATLARENEIRKTGSRDEKLLLEAQVRKRESQFALFGFKNRGIVASAADRAQTDAILHEIRNAPNVIKGMFQDVIDDFRGKPHQDHFRKAMESGKDLIGTTAYNKDAKAILKAAEAGNFEGIEGKLKQEMILLAGELHRSTQRVKEIDEIVNAENAEVTLKNAKWYDETQEEKSLRAEGKEDEAKALRLQNVKKRLQGLSKAEKMKQGRLENRNQYLSTFVSEQTMPSEKYELAA